MSAVTYSPPMTHMPEGEVALRLAFHLLMLPGASPSVRVCLDKHHAESGGKTVFPVFPFLASRGWALTEPSGKWPWLGTYTNRGQQLIVSPDSRGGDVVATIGRKRVRAECKKGKLQRTRGNPENRLVHEAIGQLMTVEDVSPGDVLIVAIPRCDHHQRKLVWQMRPLMQRVGISLVLVGRNSIVEGMPSLR